MQAYVVCIAPVDKEVAMQPVGSVHACHTGLQRQTGRWSSIQSHRLILRSNQKLRAARAQSSQDTEHPVASAITFRSRLHQSFKAASPSSRCNSRHWCHTVCQAAKQAAGKQSMEAKMFPEVGEGKTLLIIGGTGRVGASTAAALTATHPSLKIVLGSQNRASYDDAVQNRPELKGLDFKVVNRDDIDSLTKALKECDIVLHTAGPFQRKKECLVLEAAIKTKTPYIGEMPPNTMLATHCTRYIPRQVQHRMGQGSPEQFSTKERHCMLLYSPVTMLAA